MKAATPPTWLLSDVQMLAKRRFNGPTFGEGLAGVASFTVGSRPGSTVLIARSPLAAKWLADPVSHSRLDGLAAVLNARLGADITDLRMAPERYAFASARMEAHIVSGEGFEAVLGQGRAAIREHGELTYERYAGGLIEGEVVASTRTMLLGPTATKTTLSPSMASSQELVDSAYVIGHEAAHARRLQQAPASGELRLMEEARADLWSRLTGAPTMVLEAFGDDASRAAGSISPSLENSYSAVRVQMADLLRAAGLEIDDVAQHATIAQILDQPVERLAVNLAQRIVARQPTAGVDALRLGMLLPEAFTRQPLGDLLRRASVAGVA